MTKMNADQLDEFTLELGGVSEIGLTVALIIMMFAVALSSGCHRATPGFAAFGPWAKLYPQTPCELGFGHDRRGLLSGGQCLKSVIFICARQYSLVSLPHRDLEPLCRLINAYLYLILVSALSTDARIADANRF